MEKSYCPTSGPSMVSLKLFDTFPQVAVTVVVPKLLAVM